MIEPTYPSKIRQVHPKILKPPQEVLNKKKQKTLELKMQNPAFKFFFMFFGEGF